MRLQVGQGLLGRYLPFYGFRSDLLASRRKSVDVPHIQLVRWRSVLRLLTRTGTRIISWPGLLSPSRTKGIWYERDLACIKCLTMSLMSISYLLTPPFFWLALSASALCNN